MLPKTSLQLTVDQLQAFSTRQLLGWLSSTRRPHVCSCFYHCGDEVLTEDQQEENRLLFELSIKIKTILKDREHIPGALESKQNRRAAAYRSDNKKQRRRYGKPLWKSAK